MARTIKEIANGMKADFVRNSKLMEVYGLEYDGTTEDDALAFYAANISAVSVESVLIWIVAACVAVVENMMDWHKKEIDTKIARERYGHAGWYEQMALKFQYGDGLSVNYTADPDANAMDGDFAESTEYATVDPEKQIVKYAYCEDDEDGIGVVLKVAKDNGNGHFTYLDPENELPAFKAYLLRVKPAGVPVEVISQGAEELNLTMTIYYDPLVLKHNGTKITDGENPIKTAVNRYLNSIGFNGELTIQALVDAIQVAEGVRLVGFDSATANGEQITHKYTPYSGYMSVNFDQCAITYEPYVKI